MNFIQRNWILWFEFLFWMVLCIPFFQRTRRFLELVFQWLDKKWTGSFLNLAGMKSQCWIHSGFPRLHSQKRMICLVFRCQLELWAGRELDKKKSKFESKIHKVHKIIIIFFCWVKTLDRNGPRRIDPIKRARVPAKAVNPFQSHIFDVHNEVGLFVAFIPFKKSTKEIIGPLFPRLFIQINI